MTIFLMIDNVEQVFYTTYHLELHVGVVIECPFFFNTNHDGIPSYPMLKWIGGSSLNQVHKARSLSSWVTLEEIWDLKWAL